MLRRWRAPYPVRRGVFYRVPSAPAWQQPQRTAGRAPKLALVRRGRFYPTPTFWGTPGPGPLVGHTQRPWQRINMLTRRGRFYPTPTFWGTPGPGPLAGRVIRPAQRVNPLPRRGQFFRLPPVSVAAVVVLPPPQRIVGRTARPLPFRRGGFQLVPQPPRQPAPQRIVGRTARAAPTRRGSFRVVPPPVPQPAPKWITAGRRQALVARRGQFLAVPTAVVISQPGPLVGHIMQPWRRVNFRARRGRFHRVPLVGLAPTPGLTITLLGEPYWYGGFTGVMTLKAAQLLFGPNVSPLPLAPGTYQVFLVTTQPVSGPTQIGTVVIIP